MTRGATETPPFQALTDTAFTAFCASLKSIFAGLDGAATINEAQTEASVINKVLVALGWGDDTLPQVNLSGKRREDVPDVLLFANAAAKATALPLKDDPRYRHGLAILEAKRWLRPLDRDDSAEATDPDVPSSQMLRYLYFKMPPTAMKGNSNPRVDFTRIKRTVAMAANHAGYKRLAAYFVGRQDRAGLLKVMPTGPA